MTESTPQLVKEPKAASPRSPYVQLLLGLVFGVCFGFLLQKGGVAKFHILIGVLLLEDWTVIQVMMSAILVGMIGIYAMAGLGMVELQPKPTRYAANALGGLVFGIGFALSAYCPGTSAAALGQGNFDALAVILGMCCGSYIFAMSSGFTARRIEPLGQRGKLVLPEVLHASPGLVVPAVAVALAVLLAVFYWLPTL